MENEKRAIMTDDTAQDRKDIYVSDDKISLRDIRRQPLWVKLSFYATMVAILLTTVYIIGKAVPWEPFVLYDYYSMPAEVCPHERVDLIQDMEIKGGLYSVDGLEGETFWLDSEGRPYGGTYFNIEDLGATERQAIPSNTLRLAPPEPGEWYMGGRGTLTGTRWGFIDVEQKIDVVTEDPVTVREWDDPICLERSVPSLVKEN